MPGKRAEGHVFGAVGFRAHAVARKVCRVRRGGRGKVRFPREREFGVR